MATFGKTTTGGTVWGLFSGSSYVGSWFTAPADGTITKIWIYARCPFTGSTDPLHGAIYSRSSSNPLNVLAQSSVAGAVGSSWNWYSVDVSYVVTSGEQVYLTAWINGAYEIDYATGTTNQSFEKFNQTFSTWQNPLVNSADFNVYNTEISIYAEYTPSSTTDQLKFRFRNDDGSETTASWKAAENAHITSPLLSNVRLRLMLNTSGDLASTAFELWYKKSTDGSYSKVPTVSNVAEIFGTVTFGAIGTGSNGSTSVAPSYPAGITAGQYLTLHVSSGGSSNPTPSTPSGWTLLATGTSTDGTWGLDAGPRRMTVFGKVADGTETGTLSVTITGGDTCRGTIARWTKSGSGSWVVTAYGADDSTSGTGVSMTFSSLEWNTGDATLVAVSQRVDGATQSSQSLTASGVTFGTRTNRASTAVTTGNDHRHVVDTFAAVTSTSKVNAAATWSYTASAAVSAGGVIVRLREYTAAITNPIYISASSNIAAGGEATTAQLTAPSGKSTSDFVTGRMWDDENGSDSIDITTDDYTELEWCLQAQSPAANSDIYQFRVYKGSTPLDSYTITPEWTIGTTSTDQTKFFYSL